MPWVPFLLFYLGVLAFACSGVLFIWYISNHQVGVGDVNFSSKHRAMFIWNLSNQEEIDFDDIDIPLSTSLLLR